MTKNNYHILVTGRVQGVGFRFFTHKQAENLHIVGWVRNLSDGRVEVLATCSESVFSQFKMKIKEGPPRSVVESCEIKKVAGVDTHSDFQILESSNEPLMFSKEDL
ncbi:MAG: acylphosphatase [Pseudobdellovibrionaceae bacterium]|nr:acylphosphatase [Bdellovibrionales bacterium]USN47649.1 MAG: acylphosphatase [Pseudobdellovibrionaceae bacterium]